MNITHSNLGKFLKYSLMSKGQVFRFIAAQLSFKQIAEHIKIWIKNLEAEGNIDSSSQKTESPEGSG